MRCEMKYYSVISKSSQDFSLIALYHRCEQVDQISKVNETKDDKKQKI